MGGPPFPSWLEGKSFQGCLPEFPGIVWDFSPTRPPRKCCKCSPCMTWSGNFIIRFGTMPHFQEGLKLNQRTRTKCKTRLVGPIFLLPSQDFSPLPSLWGLLFSVRSKLCLALHPQWQNAPGPVPIDPNKLDACSPPRQMERAGWHVAPELRPSASQTFLLHDLAQTVPLLWFLNTEKKTPKP